MSFKIASFDIGKKNFAFCIEEFYVDRIKNLPQINKNLRYIKNGTLTDSFSKIVKNICSNGKIILLENVNLTNNNSKNIDSNQNIFYNMTDILDDYIEYWDKCDIFIIEQQMSFGKNINVIALKLAQHCWSYFSFLYGRFQEIVIFPAYHKTQILGAPKTLTKFQNYKSMNKTERKKWSIEKAINILADRDDFETLSQIMSVRKKDDLSDVICQLQAFKIHRFYDNLK